MTVHSTTKAHVAKRLTAPCTRECPAGIDVPRYIGYIVSGRFAEAEAVVRERIPFPAVCGYVCYRHCEPGCRRASLDAPVAINALKRAAVDNGGQVWRQNWAQTIAPATGKRVAIVGSGPAGLTAAYYLGKVRGHSVEVFEGAPQPGGQLRIGIPSYRLPKKLLDKEISIVAETRVQIITGHRVKSLDELTGQGYDAVFIATGTCAPNKLGVEGDNLPGVTECVNFLSDVNLGKKVDLGRRVAVIGGGNVAMDGCRTALRLGADEVTIVYRRTRQEMPAHDFEVAAAEAEGVKLEFLASPLRITKEDGHLRLHLQRMQLGEPDASGRRRPVPIPGAVSAMDVDSVLLAIGQSADVPQSWGVTLNKDGTVVADAETLATSRPGVFVGGDVASGPLSVIHAIAGGRKAAQAIDRYLGGDGDIDEKLAPEEGDEQKMPADLQPQGVGTCHVAELAPVQRARTFDLVERGYTQEEAVNEARRCIRCDLWRLEGVPSVWPKGKKF